MQRQVKDLVPGDAVKLNTGTVKQIIPDAPNYPEWRIQWVGISDNLIAKVDFFTAEWVTLDTLTTSKQQAKNYHD